MSEAKQEAPQDARQASLSRVTTLDKLIPTADPPKEDPAPAEGTEGHKPGKKPINERITQLVEQRRQESERANAAETRARELEAQLETLKTANTPLDPGDKPVRSKFASEDEYLDAMADWKADQRIAKREREQAEARARAEFEAIESNWTKQVEKVKAEIPDYEEVIGEADVPISDVLSIAMKEHPQGAELLYYMAKNPDEARRISRMRPVGAIRALDALARDLSDDAEPEPPKTSKAPEPISPVKQTPVTGRPDKESFQEYRARRNAENAAKRRR